MKRKIRGDKLIIGQTREGFGKRHDVGNWKCAFSVTTFQTIGSFPKELADRFFDDMKDESGNKHESDNDTDSGAI